MLHPAAVRRCPQLLSRHDLLVYEQAGCRSDGQPVLCSRALPLLTCNQGVCARLSLTAGHMCTHTHVHTCIIDICICIYAHTSTHTHIYTHTHKQVFLGSLREIELERVKEKLSSAIMETCLALTIFREEFNMGFVAMFTALTFVKVFHWLVQDRVDYVEVTPAVSRLAHARVVAFLLMLLVSARRRACSMCCCC
jgi:hypothetical protein